MDGVKVVGAGTLNGSGVAQLTTISLPSGTHSLRAVYGGGGGSYLPSQSSAQSYTIAASPGAGFQPTVVYGLTGVPTAIVMGDFNGDHIADLAVTLTDSGNINLLLGNGNGTFQAPPRLR
jgi:hypothetical protein